MIPDHGLPGELLPKRQSIKGDVRMYGYKHERKFHGRVARKSTRQKVNKIG